MFFRKIKLKWFPKKQGIIIHSIHIINSIRKSLIDNFMVGFISLQYTNYNFNNIGLYLNSCL